MNLSGFQPCDIRGIYGDTLEAQVSPRLAWMVGRSLRARTPQGETVLIAGDGRDTTPRLLAALEAGIGEGCINLGPCVPTPLTYLAKQRLSAHTVALITASHNPPEFNGFKIQIGADPVTPREIEAVRGDVASMEHQATGSDAEARDTDGGRATPPVTEGARQLQEAWASYLDRLRRTFAPGGGRRVAVDCMHGCHSGYAEAAARHMGYAPEMLHDEALGDFGGRTPDPAVDGNLTGLRQLVAAGDFCFGVAFDGDGDRARFLDERGTPLENGTVLVLLVRYLMESGRHGGLTKVVYDQKTRLAVINALREAGVEPMSEKSGHAFIRARMIREGALMGGEKSGHFFWGGGLLYPVDAGDCGLFTVFALDAALRHFDRPLSALAATVPDSPCYTGDIRDLPYPGDRAGLLAQVAAAIDTSIYAVSTDDGVRIERPEAFAHLRASVTETGMLTAAFDAGDWPSLSAMADAVTHALPEDAREAATTIRKRIDRLRPG